jgi:para-aminobenzoate synthetase component 2
LVLIIDNYDSFTYNLVQYLLEIGLNVEVIRNDRADIKTIEMLNPDSLLISPGPGNPNDAGHCLQIVNFFIDKKPILGVCLGHQIIAQALGGKIKRAEVPMHGKISLISHDGKGIFNQIQTPYQVTRYHSLIVDKDTLPLNLQISAVSESGEIMAIRHKYLPIEGVQFHPESIMTENGHQLLKNFFMN